jgi:hypothetical protein
MTRVLVCLCMLLQNVLNFDSGSLPDIYPHTTCQETSTCLMNNIGTDPSGYIYKCIQKADNCDPSCLSEIKSYQSCTSKCLCFSAGQNFSWDCIDNCKNSTSKNFITIVDCIYEPCRNNMPMQPSQTSSTENISQPSNNRISDNQQSSQNQNIVFGESSGVSYILYIALFVFILILALFFFRKWRKSQLAKNKGYTNRFPDNYSDLN